MPSIADTQLVLRARLMTLSICTTGSISLEATDSGYERTSGSFVTDGFVVGQEVTPAGFSDLERGTILSVSALELLIDGGRNPEGPTTASLTAGLPELQGWDNVALEPVSGRPYIEEQLVPATRTLRSFPSTGGTLEDTGLYVIRWYGKADTGLRAIADAADAVLELFKPGTTLPVDTDVTVRVRSDLGPYRGQIHADRPGWSVVTITIPWILSSVN